MKNLLRFFLLVFLFQASSTFAEESTQEVHHETLEDHHESDDQLDSFQAKFRKMLTLLALIIATMIIAAWSIKKLMKTKIIKMNTDSSIKIIETRTLSPRSTLYLIEVNQQTLLIAETGAQVTHLSTISNYQG